MSVIADVPSDDELNVGKKKYALRPTPSHRQSAGTISVKCPWLVVIVHPDSHGITTAT